MLDIDRDPHVWQGFVVRTAAFPIADLITAIDRDPLGFDALLALADAEPFRRACAWQNRSIVTEMLPALRSGRAMDSARARRRLRVLASYLQRYYTRNELIGFFGPGVWGTMASDAGDTISVEYTDTIRLETSLETWALMELAQSLSHGVRHVIPPHRRPDTHVGRRGAVIAGRRVDMDATRLTVLGAVDGARTPADLASELSLPQAEIMAALDELRELGAVTHELAVAPVLRGEASLVAQVGHDDPAARRARGVLERLVAARERTLDAENADEQIDAIRAFESEFAEILRAESPQPGEASTRRFHQDRQTAAVGRTPLSLIGERRAAIALPQAGARTARDVALVLRHPARWLTSSVGDAFLQALSAVFDAMSPDGAELPLRYLIQTAYDLSADRRLLEAPRAELVRRWQLVLAQAEASHEGELDLGDVSRAVPVIADAFSSERPIWFSGTLHSPDLMWRGPRASAGAVVGELHLATVTADEHIGASFARAADLIADGYAAHPSRYPQFVVLHPTGRDETSALSYPSPHLAHDRVVYLSLDEPSREFVPARGRVISIGDCTVARGAGGDLEITAGDVGAFPALVVLGEFVSNLVSSAHSLFPRNISSPRVRVGPIVIHRRSWVLPLEAIVGLSGPELRALLEEHGVPRHTFWRIGATRKPQFLDSRSELLCASLRDAADRVPGDASAETVSLVEMLPTPEEAWFPDEDGFALTSEFRMTFID